jgi:predicted nucleic acid-binding protein
LSVQPTTRIPAPTNSILLTKRWSFGIQTKKNFGVEICRDPKDDKFLELAKFVDAQFIVTGDKDLLEIGVFEDVKIVNLAEFFELLNALQ